MKSTTFVLLQALALGALGIPVENKDTPPFDYHKGMTREQEGRKLMLGALHDFWMILR
jgi:hypothetical protein